MLRRIGRVLFKLLPLWTWRVALYAVFGAVLAVGGSILSLRYWLLPNVDAYRADIERRLSEATGQQIRIGRISGNWQGLRPHIAFADVRILDARGEPAIVLESVDNTLSWLSLVFLEPRFHAILIHRPHLAVRRDAAGALSIAGIALDAGEGGGGLSDWVLRQREVVIRDAVIEWRDEQLAAPDLTLSGVTMRIYNEGTRHRIGLRAVPPSEIGSPLDVRADLTGHSVRALGRWEGALFVQVDYADLAAWRRWIPFPIDLPRGAGALRMWVDFANEQVKSVIADLRLADVRARLAPDLPELDLTALAGRIGWQSWKQGSEFTTRQLSIATQGGSSQQPVDLKLRRLFGRSPDQPDRNELTANALDLGPLAALADHLPLDAELRERLRRYEPRGILYDLAAKWTGSWPLQSYQVKVRFENLGVAPNGAVPGFSNVHGTLDANERRGALALANQRAVASLPRVFSDPIELDQVSAQVTWTHAAGAYDVQLANVSFGNAHLAGSVQGSYRSVPERSGVIDLTGSLSRADARHLARYLPLAVGGATREWLLTAIVGGQSKDVQLRLKGDLAQFPYADGRGGTFKVTSRVAGGALDYAHGWPRIENATVDLAFSGTRMEIRSEQASIFGVRLSRARAVIADLNADEPILEISGEGEGPTADFLRYIAESPVAAMIDRFTDGMQAQGRGRLALSIEMPVSARAKTRVSGSYHFAGNQVVLDAAMPALEQVNGRLELSNSAVRLAGIQAQVFGGPVTISGSTQSDGSVLINAQGRASLDALRATSAQVPFANQLSGSTDWRGTLTVRQKLVEFVIESNMQGVASTLPAPLFKSAADLIALRIERRITGEQQDVVNLAWGDSAHASFARRFNGRTMQIDRGAIGFGRTEPLPERPGLWLAGALPGIDLDQWRVVLAGSGEGGGASPWPALAGIDLRMGTAELFGRRFHDLVVKGREDGGRWVAGVAARELSGEVAWRAQGRGQLVVRMKSFTLPAPVTRIGTPATKAALDQPADYPALDVSIDEFTFKGKALGQLQLVATPDGRDWRIDRLRITSPEATLHADGVWRASTSDPRTQLAVRLEVSDIGKYLARMGLPEGVRGGVAKLEGPLSWSGPPQEIDYPSLSGSMMLAATKGQFVKLEPGIGKLLSILSLQALPRRVALDFKDVFSEGFAFDEIIGAFKVQQGVANTETLRMNGSSARVAMAGDFDLTRETQKLKVRVIPSVGDSVSTVTTLIGGPVAGLGMFIAQKLLNDPFGQLAAHEYVVTGSWSDPQVTRAPTAAARAETPN